MINRQPKIKIETTVSERFIELIVVFVAIAVVVFATILWTKLPETVPTKFGTNGKIEGYGSKKAIMSLIPLMIILYTGLSFLQKIPHAYNYVVKITEENAASQYKIAVRLMRMIKLEILVLFAYLYLIIILSAKEGTMVMGIWFLPVTILVMFISIGVYIVKSIKAK